MANADQGLRFSNVSLHRLGQEQNGTLFFTQHHFYFCFYPATGAQDGNTGTSSALASSAPSARSSVLAEASLGSAASTLSDDTHDSGKRATGNGPVERTAAADDKEASDKRKEDRRKQRPTEIWVPYPMISYCILRSSHSQNQNVRPQGGDEHVNAMREDDGLFPPTFGTASYGRPSSDSTRLGSYGSPPRPASPVAHGIDAVKMNSSARQPTIRIRLKDFRMMALHFHATQSETSVDEAARQAFYLFRSRSCVDRIEDFHAFHYNPPKEEGNCAGADYDARREFARMGISGKAVNGPGTAWRITDINQDYSYSATYPNVLCVPRSVSDNMLKYGGVFRSRSRIPCLTYLHSNGGSITRSSQPMVGVQNKRNPQDERLVSAIFSSHTPPLQAPEDEATESSTLALSSELTVEGGISDSSNLDHGAPGIPVSQSDTALDEKMDEPPTPIRKIYGSTRRNLILDARPKINALANRATGGGIEDVSNYKGSNDMPVEKVFLSIANIHVMRASLDKVIESFANSDYIDMKPDQEILRKSGWLGHIAGLIEGAEMVARVVGLGGSHALVHCSDGWDRTAQVSALAQIMLDPHYRTLDGFISLVQKDFISFGHKFRDRDGIESSEKWFEIENERIPSSRNRESNNSDPTSLNALGAKALTGAKSWFEKNRANLFRQQNSSRDSVAEQTPSRPETPPPNPLVHSSPTSTGKEEKEHKMSEKEVAPIFHQFLDAVFQLLHQDPNIFEFNERFLRRLFYHTFSCQYGEFLFNCEKERALRMGKARSVWPYFLSRKAQFTNPDYVPKVDDPLVFSRRRGPDREVEVRWWNDLFGRKDEEMNLPRAFAQVEPTSPTATPALDTSVSFDERSAHEIDYAELKTPSAAVKTTKSTSDFDTMKASFSTWSIHTETAKSAEPISTTHNNKFEEGPEDADAENVDSAQATDDASVGIAQKAPVAMEYDGDPLGVTSSAPRECSQLDFAAFAAQTGFQDR